MRQTRVSFLILVGIYFLALGQQAYAELLEEVKSFGPCKGTHSIRTEHEREHLPTEQCKEASKTFLLEVIGPQLQETEITAGNKMKSGCQKLVEDYIAQKQSNGFVLLTYSPAASNTQGSMNQKTTKSQQCPTSQEVQQGIAQGLGGAGTSNSAVIRTFVLGAPWESDWSATGNSLAQRYSNPWYTEVFSILDPMTGIRQTLIGGNFVSVVYTNAEFEGSRYVKFIWLPPQTSSNP